MSIKQVATVDCFQIQEAMVTASVNSIISKATSPLPCL